MEAWLTPLVDGELDPAARARVERHLAGCGACRARVHAEAEARALLHARRPHLTGTSAPPSLHGRLAAVAAAASTRRQPAWRRLPVAAAATLVLAASGLTLHVATGRSATVLAAQLAADHVKCHLFEHDRGGKDPAALQARLATHGFDVVVPAGRPDLQLRVIGVRRCLTGRGTNAHILYLAAGRPVSLYFVPHGTAIDDDLDVLGQHAHAWSRHNGTYVLVADRAVEAMPEITAHLQAATD